jgi:stage V sporulation protein D (sporulation-specific penicillin-binding protein)
MSALFPTRDSHKKEITLNRRATCLIAFLALAALLLVCRLVQLQGIEHAHWSAAASAIQEQTIEVLPQRGTIYDRNGIPLAYDVKAVAIAIDSFNMTKPETLAGILAEELDRSIEFLEDRLYRPSYFTWIDRKVSLEAARAVKQRSREEGAYGLVFIDTWKRCYPQTTLASNLIGFVGTDGEGLEGMELAFDQLLAGSPTQVHLVEGADGRIYRTETLVEGEPGGDLHLTIDARLQHICEDAIDRGVSTFKAQRGFIVLLDPDSGDVLAMAQDRRVDLNRFQQSSSEDRRNLAVGYMFEPGSSFKAFAGLAALDCGSVRVNDQFNGDDGIRVAGHTMHNAENRSFGTVTFAEIIENSINTGMVRVALELGEENLQPYLVSFGFGEKTGLEFPGEEAGILRDAKDWSQLDLAAASIGQSVAVTGIQLARGMAAIANGGSLLTPRIVCETEGGNQEPLILRRVASETSCTTMRELLRRVIESGTGTWAAVPGFAAAAKTGTAQKAFPGRGYVSGKYTSLIAGFLPVDDPAYVAVVVLDEVGTDPVWGGYTAGQIFADAMSRIVKLEHLPPVAALQ